MLTFARFIVKKKEMRCRVRCGQCGRIFVGESVVCGGRLIDNAYQDSRRGRESSSAGRVRFQCPSCGATLLVDMRQAQNSPSAINNHIAPNHQSAPRTRKAPARFFSWLGCQIRTFRGKYADADLWLFFIGSILFIATVIAVLFLFAHLTNFLADVQAWLFRQYLSFKHSLW